MGYESDVPLDWGKKASRSFGRSFPASGSALSFFSVSEEEVPHLPGFKQQLGIMRDNPALICRVEVSAELYEMDGQSAGHLRPFHCVTKILTVPNDSSQLVRRSNRHKK